MRAKTIEVLRIEIAKMRLEPDEVLVVKFVDTISPEHAATIAREIQTVLPKTKVLIGSTDVVFSTISQKILCEECRANI